MGALFGCGPFKRARTEFPLNVVPVMVAAALLLRKKMPRAPDKDGGRARMRQKEGVDTSRCILGSWELGSHLLEVRRQSNDVVGMRPAWRASQCAQGRLRCPPPPALLANRHPASCMEKASESRPAAPKLGAATQLRKSTFVNLALRQGRGGDRAKGVVAIAGRGTVEAATGGRPMPVPAPVLQRPTAAPRSSAPGQISNVNPRSGVGAVDDNARHDEGRFVI